MTYHSISNLASGSVLVGRIEEISINEVGKKAASKRVLKKHKSCPGNTWFTEEDVQVAYIRNKGVALRTCNELGYAGTPGAAADSLRRRLRNMGPAKMRRLNTLIKLSKELPPLRLNKRGGKLVLFYRIERLLEYYFAGAYKGTYPPELADWNPEDSPCWGKCFIRNNRADDEENTFFDFWEMKRAEARAGIRQRG